MLGPDQSPGEIQRREVSWTLTKKLETFAGPGEIKRREVSWTLTKKLETFAGQARSRGGRWCWTVKLAQKRSSAERWSRALNVGLLLLQLLLNSSATDIVFVIPLCTAVETAIS